MSDGSDASSSTDQGRTLEALEEAAQQGAYEASLALVKALRGAGELERLRDARERFASRFPLAEDVWSDWIDDEASLLTTHRSQEDRERFQALLERSCADYLSVTLWEKRLKLGIRGRDETQAAVDAVGHHFLHGAQFWDKLQEDLHGDDCATKECLFSRACAIINDNGFEKAASVLPDSKSELLLARENFRETRRAFGEAENILEKFGSQNLLPGQDGASPELIGSWLHYLDLALSRLRKHMSKDWARKTLVCFFERAVGQCCLVEQIWLSYADVAQFQLKDEDRLDTVVNRAIRHCPWDVRLWKIKFLRLERRVESFDTLVDELGELLIKVLQSGLRSNESLCEILLESCHAYRRFALSHGTTESLREQLKQQFVYAADVFRSQYPQIWAGQARILEDFSRCLYDPRVFPERVKDTKLEELWKSLLSTFEDSSGLYFKMIALQRDLGNLDECRALFKKALHMFKSGDEERRDDQKKFAKSWVELEQRYGTLDSLDQARHQAFRVIDLKDFVPKEMKKKKDVGKKRRMENGSGENVGNKKAKTKVVQEMETDKKPIVVETEMKDERKEGGNTAIFVVNLNYNSMEDEIKEHFSQVGEVRKVSIKKNKRGNPKGTAVVEFALENALHLAFDQLQGMPLRGRALKLVPYNDAEEAKKDQVGEQKLKNVKAEEARLSVYVGGIPVEFCSASEISEGSSAFAKALRECGSIAVVEVAANKASLRVMFEKTVAVDKALELNKREFEFPGTGLRMIKVQRFGSQKDEEAKTQKHDKQFIPRVIRKRKPKVQL